VAAVRLRRVGNQGILVDPGAVVAAYSARDPDAVVLLLASGAELNVWIPPYDDRAHRRRRVTIDDVANVAAALTDRRP
jgi:hypothetical protein